MSGLDYLTLVRNPFCFCRSDNQDPAGVMCILIKKLSKFFHNNLVFSEFCGFLSFMYNIM